jgi:hypothetical protein
MKIRTIVGILLVFALVLGSTGIAAADDKDRDRDRTCWDDRNYPPGWNDETPPSGKTPNGFLVQPV